MKYTREILAEAAANSTSIAGVLRFLGVRWTGGSHAHISRRLKKFEIDTTHFTGSVHNKGMISPRRMSAADILIVRPPTDPRAKPHRLRRALIELGVSYCCTECGLGPVWQEKPLVLHVDHINGDFSDSRQNNLRFLCPNCHTQTFNYAGRATNRRDQTPADSVDAIE